MPNDPQLTPAMYADRDIRYCNLSYEQWQTQATHYYIRDSTPYMWSGTLAGVGAQFLFMYALAALIMSVVNNSGLQLIRLDVQYVPHYDADTLLYQWQQAQAGLNLLGHTETDTVVNLTSVRTPKSTFPSFFASSVTSSCYYSVYTNITQFVP